MVLNHFWKNKGSEGPPEKKSFKMEPSWGRLGAFFGAVLGLLGAVLGRFWVVLGLPGVVLGRLGAVSVAVLGHPCIRWSSWAREASRRPPGANTCIKTHSFLHVWGSRFGRSWCRLGVLLGPRAPSWGRLGPSSGRLCGRLGPSVHYLVRLGPRGFQAAADPPGCQKYTRPYAFWPIWGV